MRETIENLILGALLFSHGYFEFNQGIKIIFKNERVFTWIVLQRMRMIEFFIGENARRKYEKKFRRERNWKLWGFLGIFYGIFSMSAGTFLLILAAI